jgi:hypothetical protein
LVGWYNPLARHPYIGDVCLVAKVAWEHSIYCESLNSLIGRARSMLEAHLVPGLGTKMLGKHHTSHTKEAHERYLMSKSLISRLAGQEKMVQQLLSAGLALSSIWKKARARDRQRKVAGDKGQWGFVLEGMRPPAETRARGGQREVVGDKGQWALF